MSNMRQKLSTLIWLINKHRVVLLVVLVGSCLDQGTKYWVKHTMDLGQSIPSEGFFRITYVYNTGSIFGLFPSQNTILTVGSLFGIGVLIWAYRTYAERALLIRISLGLLLAGAIGNLIDRLAWGRVTDFIDVGIWPIFNIADSCVVVGIVTMIWVLLVKPSVREKHLTQSDEEMLSITSRSRRKIDARNDE